ncbi:MAG: hypothetical protein AAB492_04180 [Patescibacteria group bacterium]
MKNLEVEEGRSIFSAKKEFNDAVDREDKIPWKERVFGKSDQAEGMDEPKEKNILQKIFHIG